jgi:hypothetical protein
LYHILVILAVFQTFHYFTCYDGLLSVIFDVAIVIVLEYHKPHLYMTVNLNSHLIVP